MITPNSSTPNPKLQTLSSPSSLTPPPPNSTPESRKPGMEDLNPKPSALNHNFGTSLINSVISYQSSNPETRQVFLIPNSQTVPRSELRRVFAQILRQSESRGWVAHHRAVLHVHPPDGFGCHGPGLLSHIKCF